MFILFSSDRINSLRRVFWANNISLIQRNFEVFLPSQENEWSYMWVRSIDFASASMIFCLDFGTVVRVCYVFNTCYYYDSLHSWPITGPVVSRVTRRVSPVEQELLTFLEHLSSPPDLSRVIVTRYLVLCVCFVDRCLSFCTFSFGHCVVCPSSNYGFWLPPFGIFKLLLLWTYA